MTPLPFAPHDRAALYASSRSLAIQKEELGSGYDGTVLATNKGTALKVLNNPQLYRQELTIYQHLKKKNIHRINDFQVPQLIDFDDTLSIIEMTIVSPPFVLDFASARLERMTDFDDEIMAAWEHKKREEFEGDWAKVRVLIWEFEKLGVYLSDVHPRNVMCR